MDLNSECIQMVEECRAKDPRLCPWERDFINSMHTWGERGRNFTPHQKKIITQIWDVATENG